MRVDDLGFVGEREGMICGIRKELDATFFHHERRVDGLVVGYI